MDGFTVAFAVCTRLSRGGAAFKAIGRGVLGKLQAGIRDIADRVVSTTSTVAGGGLFFGALLVAAHKIRPVALFLGIADLDRFGAVVGVVAIGSYGGLDLSF